MRRWLLRFLYPWHLFQGQHSHSPQPQGAPNGGHTDLLNQRALEAQTAQSLKLFALSHLKGASHTLLSSKPPLHRALIHSCHAVMEAQLSNTSSSVLSQARVAPGPHPILSCWGTELRSTSHLHPLQKAVTLLRGRSKVKARSKSHFLKKITFSLCANSDHPTLCDCSPPRGQQWTKGTEAPPL